MTLRILAARWSLAALTALLSIAHISAADAQETAQEAATSFAPPPRTISDITSILDKEKSDPARRAKIEAEAAALPPAGAGRQVLAKHHHKVAQSFAELGRYDEAIANIKKASEYSTDYLTEGSRFDQFLERLYRTTGEYKLGVDVLEQVTRKLEALPRTKGRFFSINDRMTVNYLFLGDVKRAEAYLKKNEALLAESRSWQNVEQYRPAWSAHIENAKGRVSESRGRLAEAEAAFQRYVQLERDSLVKSKSWPNPPPPDSIETAIDFGLAGLGRVRAAQGRVAEGESDVRRALLSRLKAVGKYHGDTVRIIGNLAGVLSDQGRFPEMEKLIRTCLEIYEALGYPPDSAPLVGANYRLGVALFAQRRYADAKVQFEKVDAATQSWPAQRSVGYRTSWSRVVIDYNTRNVPAGIERAREQLAAQKLRKGEAHYDTAMARAVLATGLTYARRDAEALAEFKLSMPILLNATHDDEEGDLTARLSAEGRLQTVAEANMVLIARAQDPQSAATESFKIGEAIRGRSVQNALEASAARSAAKTAALAELVRKEQDLAKQTAALAGSINAVQDLSPEERDDNALKALQAELDAVRNDRRNAKREIERRFPEYNNLINPKPVTVADVQAALGADEALVSFHFGRRESFVWAIRKAAPPIFAVLPTNVSDIAKRVKQLRKSLEPNASTVGEIPPFDLKAAYDLYSLLLKPIEPGWQRRQQPHRRNQWRARIASARLVAGRAGNRCRRRRALFLGLPQGGLAGAYPRRDDGAIGIDAAHAAAGRKGLEQARFDDRLRRPVLQCRSGKGSLGGSRGARGRGDDARAADPPACGSANSRHRWRGDRAAAAPARYRRRAEIDRHRARGGPGQGAASGQEREREDGEKPRSLALSHCRVRDAWPGARRAQRLDAAGTGPDGAERGGCRRRRTADRG